MVPSSRKSEAALKSASGAEEGYLHYRVVVLIGVSAEVTREPEGDVSVGDEGGVAIEVDVLREDGERDVWTSRQEVRPAVDRTGIGGGRIAPVRTVNQNVRVAARGPARDRGDDGTAAVRVER